MAATVHRVEHEHPARSASAGLFRTVSHAVSPIAKRLCGSAAAAAPRGGGSDTGDSDCSTDGAAAQPMLVEDEASEEADFGEAARCAASLGRSLSRLSTMSTEQSLDDLRMARSSSAISRLPSVAEDVEHGYASRLPRQASLRPGVKHICLVSHVREGCETGPTSTSSWLATRRTSV